jgi:squalene-hopene/tetraprenyl-beta-curcumene cyclase
MNSTTRNPLILIASSLTLIALGSSCWDEAPKSITASVPAPEDELVVAIGQDSGPAAVSSSHIKDSIDRSVRFLRADQDPKSGQFGGGVEDTARVLIAMADSPRKYTVMDGPFLESAADYLANNRDSTGLIFDANATTNEAKIQQTLLAAYALARISVPGFGATEAEGKALAEAAEAVDAVTFAAVQGKLLPGAEALGLADLHKLLASQDEAGAFPAAGGSVAAATASSMAQLTANWDSIRASEVKPASEIVPLAKAPAADQAKVTAAMNRGALYLVNEGAVEPGRWGAMGNADAGITAMVLGGLLATPEPRPAEVDAAINTGLAWLVSLQKEDGSIQTGQLANYVTSASILALAAADRPEFKETIEEARGFLTALQADEGEGYAPGHRYYGGMGYGGDERPDLSNLQMAMDALAASGTKAEDESFNKALAFLERCQNRSESNDIAIESPDGKGVIKSGNDGGSGYAPGESKAGFMTLADGTRVPRSYGSMTFALLKGYLLAGLEKDDPRVVATWKWITANYSLDLNPGFETSADPSEAYQGLFYYFLAMARALELYGDDEITTADGVTHNWKRDLGARLTAMQKGDGSWENTNSPRWYEGNPTLATAYALVIMESTL